MAGKQSKRGEPPAAGGSSLAARVVARALADPQSLVRALVLGEVIGERPAERRRPGQQRPGPR